MAHAVELGLLGGLDIDVDARHALGHADEVGLDAGLRAEAAQLVAREAGDKAESAALVPEVAEHDGDVHALAAREHLLVGGAVDGAQAHVVHPDDVVERRVERYGADHRATSTTLL